MFSNKKVLKNEFVKSLRKTTPARIGIGHVGGRYPTEAQLAFAIDLATAKDTVRREVDDKTVKKLNLLAVSSRAESREQYLRNTSCGRKLDEKSVAILKKKAKKSYDVALLVSEGLSAEAFDNNVPQMIPLILSRLNDENLSLAPIIYVKRARVAIMDHIGDILKPKASLFLIGERPGLGISDSLSGYFEYKPCSKRVESDRNVLSNIHGRGMPPAEAALMLAEALIKIITIKKSGMTVRFDFQ